MTSPRNQTADTVTIMPPETIQAAFNESQISRDVAAGALGVRVLTGRHLSEPQSVGEPWCTHSQYLRYVDAEGVLQVEVHQYLRPDGTIGASGRLDPKLLRVGPTELWRVPVKPVD